MNIRRYSLQSTAKSLFLLAQNETKTTVAVLVEASWNVIAHAQKTDFAFRRNELVHLNRPEGASVQSTTGSRGVRIGGSNAGYTMFRGSVKVTGYPLHSPVSPSLPLPCVNVSSHFNRSLHTWSTHIHISHSERTQFCVASVSMQKISPGTKVLLNVI